MASTIDASVLPAYVEQYTDDLLTKSMFGAKSLNYFEIMPNVKGSQALNYLDSTVVLADASVCGFTAQGSDIFTQRVIATTPLKVNKEWCDRDFLNKWMQHDLLLAAGREKLPFEEKLVDTNIKAIANELEKVIWQGNTVVDGILDVIADASLDVIDVSVGSNATIIDKIDAVYMAIPGEVLEKDPVIFVSYTDFRSYVKALNDECCANRGIVDANVEDYAYAGDSRVTIVPVGGLEGNNRAIVAGARDNFVYATDVEDAHSTFKLWYSDDDDLWKFKVLFNMGVQIKFPSETVILQ